MADWLYYLYALILMLLSVLGWLGNLLGLPGNWAILGGAALFAYLIPVADGQGVAWQGVGLLAALAVLGEVIEFFAGAAGAAKHGASRRAVVLACLGAVVGGLAGVVVGVPVPVVGSLIAALFGSAAGAFAGAYLGEKWLRRSEHQSLAAGRGAFFGRLWGTAGKLLVGAVMLVVLAADLFFV